MSHRRRDGTDCPNCSQYGVEGERRPSCRTCDRCHRGTARAQRCPGDGAWHHHGEVHVKDGGREFVCDACIIDVALEWNPHLTRDQLAGVR
jgi:hypothetical protein